MATGVLVERLRGHRDSVYSVAFTPDGKGLVSGSLDKTLKFWDVSGLNVPNGKRKDGPGGGSGATGPGTPGQGAVVKNGDKSSQCTMNFTGHKVPCTRFLHVRSRELIRWLQDYVLSVAVSHDGQWVVSGSKDRGVQFWDARSAAVQCMLQGHKNSVISIDLSPMGGLLATGSGDWQARICKLLSCHAALYYCSSLHRELRSVATLKMCNTRLDVCMIYVLFLLVVSTLSLISFSFSRFTCVYTYPS